MQIQFKGNSIYILYIFSYNSGVYVQKNADQVAVVSWHYLVSVKRATTRYWASRESSQQTL